MTELELIKKAKQGDKEAQNKIIKDNLLLVKKIAKNFFISGADEEDLVQIGMEGILDAIKNYEPDKNTLFSSFAYICIRRKILTAVNSSQTYKNRPLNHAVLFSQMENEDGSIDNLIPDDCLNEMESEEEEKERLNRINDLINKELTEQEKRVLLLFIEEKTYEEIANFLGVTTKAIDGTLQRARKKLKKAYKG